MSIAAVIATALVVVATLLIVATVIALWRAPDAVTRANLMGPTTGVAAHHRESSVRRRRRHHPQQPHPRGTGNPGPADRGLRVRVLHGALTAGDRAGTRRGC